MGFRGNDETGLPEICQSFTRGIAGISSGDCARMSVAHEQSVHVQLDKRGHDDGAAYVVKPSGEIGRHVGALDIVIQRDRLEGQSVKLAVKQELLESRGYVV